MSSVSRVTEISVVSDLGFDDAVRLGIERATQTLRGVSLARVTNQEVVVRDGKPVGYRVDLVVSFVLDGQYAGELPPYPDPAHQSADFVAFEE